MMAALVGRGAEQAQGGLALMAPDLVARAPVTGGLARGQQAG
jgi:hypothetical protein